MTVGDLIEEVKKHFNLSSCKLMGFRPSDSKVKMSDATLLSQCTIANKKFIGVIGTTVLAVEQAMSKQAQCLASAFLDEQEEHHEWIMERMNDEIKKIEDDVVKRARPHMHKSMAVLKFDERKAMVEYACIANKLDMLKFTGLLGGKGEEPVNAVQALHYCAMLNRQVIFGYILGHDKAQLKRAEEMGVEVKTRLLGRNGDSSYGRHTHAYSALDSKEFGYVATACQYGNLDFVKLLLSDSIPNEAADASHASNITIPGFRPMLYPLGLVFWRQCISLSLSGGHLKQTRWLLNEAKKHLTENPDDESKLLEVEDLWAVCARGYLGHAQYLVSRGFPVTDVLMAAANLYINSSNNATTSTKYNAPRHVCLNLLKFLASKSSAKLMRELLDYVVVQHISEGVGVGGKQEVLYRTMT